MRESFKKRNQKARYIIFEVGAKSPDVCIWGSRTGLLQSRALLHFSVVCAYLKTGVIIARAYWLSIEGVLLRFLP
jgi:hypothetical protein